jgi:isopentenyldiphosphate isomerase
MVTLLDIVDGNDFVVATRPMLEIRSSELSENNYLRYVNVLAFNKEGLLLLPKRPASSSHDPNCYDFSSGKYVLSGETYLGAVKRAIDEELGVVDPSIEFLGKLSPMDGVSGFMGIYRITIDESDIDYNQDDFQSLEWYDINTVIKMIENNPTDFKSDLGAVLKWYRG